MAVNLSLSADQAALLLPILQQIAGKGVSGQSAGASDRSQSRTLSAGDLESPRVRATVCVPYTPDTASSTDLESDSSSNSKYTLEELLVRKGKNMKSSDAQNFLLYTVREAAKGAGFWESAPYMEEISPQKLEKFYETVFSSCPVLRGAKKKLRKRLRDTLMNRRAHLRALQIKSPRKKSNKPCPKHLLQPVTRSVVSTPSTSAKSTPSMSSRSSQIEPSPLATPLSSALPSPATEVSTPSRKAEPGTVVDIVYGDSEIIGTGILLLSEDDIFSSVILKSKQRKISESINLYEPVDNKLCFADLKIADVFKWKTAKLHFKGSKVSVAEEGDTSSDEFSESEQLSSYEKERLKRIEKKKVMQQIMKGSDFDSDNESGVFDHDEDSGMEVDATVTANKCNSTKSEAKKVAQLPPRSPQQRPRNVQSQVVRRLKVPE